MTAQSESPQVFSRRNSGANAPLLLCSLCPSEADGIAKVLTGKKVADGGFMIIIDTLPLCEKCYTRLKSEETVNLEDLDLMKV